MFWRSARISRLIVPEFALNASALSLIGNNAPGVAISCLGSTIAPPYELVALDCAGVTRLTLALAAACTQFVPI